MALKFEFYFCFSADFHGQLLLTNYLIVATIIIGQKKDKKMAARRRNSSGQFGQKKYNKNKTKAAKR